MIVHARRPRTVLPRIALAAGTLFATSAPFASAAVCPPAAVVEGSAEIAPAVSLLLQQHGVGPGPSACGAPIIRAVLRRDAPTNKFTLRIVDGYGRASERKVASAKDAASLIESWATAEDADLILPPALPATPALSAAPPPQPSPIEPRWHILTVAEISRASDDSTWYGGAATVCRRVGPVCVGARARGARDPGRPLFTGELKRTALDGAIAAGTGVVRGRFTLAPMLALGARWTHATLTAAVPIPVSLSTDDVGFHAEAGALVACALSRRWSVTAEVGGSAGLLSTSQESSRPPFFTLTGAVPPDPVPRPPAADVHVSLGLALAP